MRIVAMLLTVLLISPAAHAVKPEKPGPSLDETMMRINERLQDTRDLSSAKCGEMVQVSVSNDHRELLVEHVLVDRHGRVVEGKEPRFVYRVPVARVQNIYAWGPWVTNNQVIVRTRGRVVIKDGPAWTCGHHWRDDVRRERLLDSVSLKMYDTDKVDQADLNGIVDGLNHMVKLLQAETNAKSESQQNTTPDPKLKNSTPEHP